MAAVLFKLLGHLFGAGAKGQGGAGTWGRAGGAGPGGRGGALHSNQARLQAILATDAAVAYPCSSSSFPGLLNFIAPGKCYPR